jgi:hypothetical protein
MAEELDPRFKPIRCPWCKTAVLAIFYFLHTEECKKELEAARLMALMMDSRSELDP